MELEIYQYSDYRAFLRDAIRARKVQDPKYSLSVLSRESGAPSKSMISLILKGERSLAPERALSTGRALGLRGRALQYFDSLVRYQGAQSTHERVIHAEDLRRTSRSSAAKKVQELPFESYALLEAWHGLVLRELVRLPDFNPDPHWISRKLKRRVTPAQAKRVWKLLVKKKVVQKSVSSQGQEGWSLTSELMRTHDELKSRAIQSYHQSCLKLASQVLESDRVEDREFGSVNLTVSSSQVESLKAQIKEFRDQLVKQHQVPADATRVCQINVQLLTLTEDRS